MGDEESEEAAAEALKLTAAGGGTEAAAAVRWEARPGGGLQLQHKHSLAQITWHSRGDYFATVAPTGNTQVPLLLRTRTGISCQRSFARVVVFSTIAIAATIVCI